MSVDVANDRDEDDFVTGLQGFAAMCERSLSVEDGPMLAAKFRDAAFVIDQLQKLRDAQREALVQATQQEFSMARRMRAAIVEARRFLAQTRFSWNGPIIRADGVLAEALSVRVPVRKDGEHD